MLNRKQPEQKSVDNDRFRELPCLSRVNRFRNDNIADETDCVEERDQENQITNYPIEKSDSSTKHIELLSAFLLP